MASVSPNDPRPPFVQIADDLRRAIRSGALPPGERIESGRELAKRYAVAQMTVHNALNVLKDEQLLVSVQGRGVFVSDPLPGEAADGAPSGDLAALRAEVADLRGRVASLERRLPM